MVGRKKKYSNEEILRLTEDLYNNWGDTLYSTIDVCDDMPCLETYSTRFGGISEARDMAGVETYKFKQYERIQQHLRELRDIERETGFVDSDDVLYKLFDDSTSITDIREMAGLNFTNGKSKRSKVCMIEDLRSIDSDIVSSNDINNKTKFSANQYTYTFGSITEALSIAGKYNASNNSSFWKSVIGIPKPTKAISSVDGYDENKNYYVYRIHFDNSFYIGMTNNICRRMSICSTSDNREWPGDKPIDIDIESFDSVDAANEREREITLETAIEFDTNNVYGGHHDYKNVKK